jgi:multidrug efflux system membrane fusion protein
MNDVARSEPAPQAVDRALPPTRRSRIVAACVVVFGILALGVLGWYLAHRNPTRGFGGMPRGRPTATVGLATAERADLPITLDALGTVTPLATAVVRAQVNGVLTEVLFREGQMVERGAPLAQIDPRPFQLALEQAEGNLARDEASLAAARVTLTRDRTLLTQDSIAQQDVDTQEATVKQLEGTVITDRAAIGTARLNLGWSRITAPVAGRVGLRAVDPGNSVSTTDANGIATITQLRPMDVEFALPSDAIGAVQKRIATKAELATTALDRTRSTTLAQGVFLTLDNQVDPTTGTVHAKARFANSEGTLFPQQFVNIRLLLETKAGAIVVPAAALRHGPQGDFVFVVSADHTAHVRAVRIGPAAGDRVAIDDGVAVGEQVVTEGGDRLTDGAPVRLPGAGAAGPRTAGARPPGAPGPSGRPPPRPSGGSAQ